MADFHSAGNQPDDSETAASIARNTRIGLILFAFYFVLYAIFVFMNTFYPAAMEWTPWEGINIDVIYGFVLILAAIVLALIYGWLCSQPTDRSPADREVRS